MPRYFIDIHNSKFSAVDDEGREFADREEASGEALRLLCAVAESDPLQHLHGRLGAVVRNGTNHVILTATVSLSTTWVGDA